MNTKELRIGNFVKDNLHGNIVKVDSVHDNGINDIEDQYEYLDDGISGIVLTEEWLLKFGFEKVHHFGNYELTKFIEDGIGGSRSNLSIEIIHYSHNNSYLLRLVSEPDEDYENQTSINYHGLNNIQYIHQLQNLYFALTNNEISCKQ